MRKGICGAALSMASVAVIIVVILAVIAIPVLFLQFRALDVREEKLIPSAAALERIDLNVTATVGQLNIDFVDLPGASARVIAEVRGHSSFFGDASPLRLDVVTMNENAELRRNISAAVFFDTYAPWPYYSLSESIYTVEINKSLKAGLNLTVVTGGIKLSTVDGVVLEGLKLNATSKGALVSLNNGTVLDGDIKIKTATGGTVLRWNNVTVQGDRVITMTESSGMIDARFDQTAPLGGRVSVLSKQTAGETHIIARLSGENSARIWIKEGIAGAKLVDLGGFSGTLTSFQSNNYPSNQYFAIQVNNTIGGALVEGKWTLT